MSGNVIWNPYTISKCINIGLTCITWNVFVS